MTDRVSPTHLFPIDQAAIDPDALKTISRLQSFGYRAYLCGGGVRDLLLGRQPKDFDVATSAHPNEMRKLFRNCRIIGRRFRLAHVFFPGGKIIEVSTFRARNEYKNGDGDLLITDDNVFGTQEEDAKRRDFTINGLFYDPSASEVIDHVCGLADLADRLIDTIGDPGVRIREDPVRILRAIKFAARLGFAITPRVYLAMTGCRAHLHKSAPPRVLEEMLRMLRGGEALNSFRLLRSSGVLAEVLPPLNDYLERGAGTEEELLFWRRLEALDELRRDGVELTNAAMLAVLFASLITEELARAESKCPYGVDLGQVVEDTVGVFAIERAISRRDKARMREIMQAQRRLQQPHQNPSQLRKLMSRDYFPEALAYFQIDCRAKGTARADFPWQPAKRRRRRRRAGRHEPPSEPT